MKKLILLILIFSSPVYAESVNLQAIAHIESNGDSQAVGDNGRALGLFQLHKEPILDFNRHFKARIKHRDALKPKIAYKVASYYLNQEIPRQLKSHDIKDTTKNRLIGWNFGTKNLAKKKRIPKTTKRYIEKYNVYIK